MNTENCVIGKILFTSNLSPCQQAQVSSRDFFSSEYRKAFEFITNHHYRYDEIPSIELFESTFPDIKLDVAKEPLKFYVDKLKENSTRVSLKNSILEAAKNLTSNPISTLETLKSQVTSINTDELVEEDLDFTNIRKRKENYENSGAITGYTTPYQALTDETLGIHAGEVWSIVARPSIGKSFILCKFATHCFSYGLNVLISSQEMPVKLFQQRLDALMFNLPYTNFKKGMLTPAEKTRYYEGLSKLEDADNFIKITTARTISALIGKIKQYSPDVVFIDGAYLMVDELKGKNIWERATNISRALKSSVAMRLNIPVFAVWQFNRSSEKQDSPGLDNINLTDAVGQDSDVVLGVDAKREDLDRHERKILTLKNREGGTPNFFINFDFHTMKFNEVKEDLVDDDWVIDV